MGWCASSQLAWFGECRFRFFYGVAPRCSLCPLFDLERAVRDVLGENTPDMIEIRLEGRHYSCRVSGGGSVVLVDEATEAVAAVDLAHMRSCLWRVGVGWAKFKGTMRPLAVVMVDVDAEHAFEVASIEDQQPVEALRTDCSDEALRDRVGLRRSDGRLHDPDAFAAENLVEGAAVLAVAVADEEADALLGEVKTEVARLLGYPRRRWDSSCSRQARRAGCCVR